MLRWTPYCFLRENTLQKHAVLVNLSTCHLYPFLMGFPWKFGRQMHSWLSRSICAHMPNKLLVKPNHLSLLKRPQGLWFQRSEPLFFWRKALNVSELKKKNERKGWCKPKWISMVSPGSSELWSSCVTRLTERQNHKHSSKKKWSLKVFLQHIKTHFCSI